MASLDELPRLSAPDGLKAAGLAVAGMALIGVGDNAMPEVAAHMGLAQFQVVRSGMALALMPLVLILTRQRLWPVNPWGVLGRSALLTVAMGFYFASVGFLSVAQSLAGVFTAPLWVMLVTRAQRRPVDGPTAAWIILGFLGCLAVVQPDPGELGWLALGPLLAGFLYGMTGKVTRSWTGQESAWTLVSVYLAMIGLAGLLALPFLDPESTDYLSRGWVSVPPHVLALCFAQALVALVSVTLLARAYQLAAPAFVGAFEYSVLLVAAAVGFAIWGHEIGPLGLSGIALLLVSGAALAWRGDRA
ncbi:MAG: DMT family transporter [Pseudomonadota bacterium]